MFAEDIKKITKENTNFRKVVRTGKYTQLVLMSIPENEDIGEEVHEETDQIICIVEGEGLTIINGEERAIDKHDIVFVPAGAMHNFKNTGDEPLKLFSVYAPPEHPDGTIHQTKEEAVEAEKNE